MDSLKFNSRGLMPAIVIDWKTKDVLMHGYMNRESLQKSIDDGIASFWSSRLGRIRKKGEHSGHVLRVREIIADCNKDSILVLVERDGPVCHTGADSCFFNPVYISDEMRTLLNKAEKEKSNKHAPADTPKTDMAETVTEVQAPVAENKADDAFTLPPDDSEVTDTSDKAFTMSTDDFTLESLLSLILARKENAVEGSYTSYLFHKGIDKILKKIGEEVTDVIIAGKALDKKETVSELGDLAYHLLVLMAELGISADDVKKELEGRKITDIKDVKDSAKYND